MKQKKAKTTFSKSKRNQYSSPFRSENSAISSNMISIYLFTPPPPSLTAYKYIHMQLLIRNFAITFLI